jgi:hypothetical protein
VEELDGALYEVESPTGLTFSYGEESVSNPVLSNVHIFLANIKEEIILFLRLVIRFV